MKEYNDKENLKEESDNNNNIIIEWNNDINNHSEISKKIILINEIKINTQMMKMEKFIPLKYMIFTKEF